MCQTEAAKGFENKILQLFVFNCTSHEQLPQTNALQGAESYFCAYVSCDFFTLTTLLSSIHLENVKENSKYHVLKVDVT